MFNQCQVTTCTCYGCKDTIIFYSANYFLNINDLKYYTMTTSERFLEVLEGLKIGPYVLEKDCGVKNAQAKISHYKKGVTKAISGDIIVQLCEAYPQVNANYILTGKGGMFLDTDRSTSENIASQSQKMYKDTIIGKDKEIADLKAEIARMKSDMDKLTGQNEIMREQLGLSGRRAPTKSA